MLILEEKLTSLTIILSFTLPIWVFLLELFYSYSFTHPSLILKDNFIILLIIEYFIWNEEDGQRKERGGICSSILGIIIELEMLKIIGNEIAHKFLHGIIITQSRYYIKLTIKESKDRVISSYYNGTENLHILILQ